MNNEPVAWMTFDGEYSYELMLVQDNEDYRNEYIKRNGEKYKDWVQPLYTHPVKELNDGGEPVKNATYWKRQYNLMATQNDNLKSGLYHANEQIKYLESQIEALKIKLVEAIDAEKDRRFE